MIKRILTLIIALTALQIQAQTVLTNNGANIIVTPNTTVNVQGEIIIQNAGTIDNSGMIMLTGDWTNNAGNTGLINSSPGEVEFNGAAQSIAGSDLTRFYDLTLSGTGIKSQAVDAEVEGILDLQDHELSTGANTVFVVNPNPAAIIRTTGFVSSGSGGSLSREMNVASTYLYPVGVAGTYRPAELAPGSATANTFTVRMADNDPSSDGYDRNTNDGTLCDINALWYHHIDRSAGVSPADITLYYDSGADGDFDAMTHWQNVPQWENMGPVTAVNNTPPVLSSLKAAAWNDFTLSPFALAVNAPTAAFTPTQSGPVTTFTDNSTGNPTTWAWTFGDGGSSPLQNPTHSYANDGTYYVCLEVTNAAGCTNSYCDSVQVTGVAISNAWTGGDIQVFPNPATEKLQVNINLPKMANLQLQLFDLHGRKGYEQELPGFQSGKLEIPVQGLPSGMYMLKVIANEEMKVVKVEILH